MEPNYLHIWPRNTFMMIALPNMVITHSHASLGHGMELVGMNWLWWQACGRGWEGQQVARRDPQPVPDIPQPGRGAGQDPQSRPCLTARSRYALCSRIQAHLSPLKTSSLQLDVINQIQEYQGSMPGSVLADHTLPVSASPLPASSVCKPTMGNRVTGHLSPLR